MRILDIIQCANLGGMEHTALLRIQGLKKRGYAVRLVSLNPIGKLGPLLEASGIPAQGLVYRGKFGWKSFPLMYRAFRSEPCEAVIMDGPNLLGLLALGGLARRHRILCVHYHHQGVKPRWQWRLLYRFAVRRFQAITFPAEFVFREAERLYPPVAQLGHVLPYPFLLPPLPSEADRVVARQNLGLPYYAKVVGNAGWLIPRKRWDVFLRVASVVRQHMPEAAFVVAGDGPLRQELARLADELGLQDHIYWLGWRTELHDFYTALDVLHFNSDWDALGRTPLEAAAYGVPVVASVLIGGLREVISSERYGYLIDTHDEEWLAEKIVLLLKNPELGRQTGLACRQRLAKVCCPEKDLDRICQLLGL